MTLKGKDRKTNWNFPRDDINAEGRRVLLFLLFLLPFLSSFLFFSSLLAGTILLETVSAVR